MPLAYSVSGIAGVKAHTFEKCIAVLLAATWHLEYSELVDFVCTEMALLVVRANALLLRGARNKRPVWVPFADGATIEVMMDQCKL